MIVPDPSGRRAEESYDATVMHDSPTVMSATSASTGAIASASPAAAAAPLSAAGDDFANYRRFVNPRFARVLRLLGFDRTFVRGAGAHLFDRTGRRVIDALGGYGAVSVGHNHPEVVSALHRALDRGLPGMVHFETPPLVGELARDLLRRAPASLGKALFTNSGTEGIEAALKLSRAATGRAAFLSCERGFHGFTMGALSLVGHEPYRKGFGPLLESRCVPFGDLAALERALASRDIAAFVVEPVQGKGVYSAPTGYLAEAQRLCHRNGTLLVVDEVQTGVGRCGSFLASAADGADDPDIVVISKPLSGGMIPVGAVLVRDRVWNATFSSLDRALIHSSTFHQAPLAMSVARAVLEIMDAEQLDARSIRLGDRLRLEIAALRQRHAVLGEVRGRGLMVAFDLMPPRPLRGRLESMLWPQALLMHLHDEGGVLAQVVNQRSATVKFTPPLVIDDDDITAIVRAVDAALMRVSASVLDGSLVALRTMALNLLLRSKSRDLA